MVSLFGRRRFFQFTLCILDKFQRAHATDYVPVSNNQQNKSKNVGKKAEDVRVEIEQNMAVVGEGVKTYISIICEVESWEVNHYMLEDNLMMTELALIQTVSTTVHNVRCKCRNTNIGKKL